MSKKVNTIDFVLSKCNKSGDCLLWGGSVNEHDIPQTSFNYHVVRIPRYIYETNHGKQPRNRWITQSCGNKRCINPEHLIVSSPSLLGGRKPNKYWIAKPPSRIHLTSQEISTISEMYHNEKKPMLEIGKYFGISKWAVSRALREKRRRGNRQSEKTPTDTR